MRCKEAQKRIDAGRFNDTDGAIDADLTAHIADCSECGRQYRARQTITSDMQAVAAESRQELPVFEAVRQSVVEAPPQRARNSSPPPTTVGRALRIAVPLAAVLVAVIVAFSPFDRTEDNGYEIAVAGVSESVLSSGAINRLFAAIGLPDVEIEIGQCDVVCSFRVLGLRDLSEARLAVAAIQNVPNAVIYSVDHFVDKQTGRKITRTSTSGTTGVDENRQWVLELGVDSTTLQRVSITLDSLKQDTTFGWQRLARNDSTTTTGPREEYTVHPDGSYSNSLFADPRASLGWREHRWTFDSTGALISFLIIDTTGDQHLIDHKNWVVREQQFREVGIYYMITYDEDGTPWHTGTNVDPVTLPGYGSNLPEGYYLKQNEPNPFDTLTRITFGLPEKAPVKLTIYNANSEPVRTLLDSTMAPGEHSVTWKGRSEEGKRAWSSLFLCKLEVGEHYHTIVMGQVWPEKADSTE